MKTVIYKRRFLYFFIFLIHSFIYFSIKKYIEIEETSLYKLYNQTSKISKEDHSVYYNNINLLESYFGAFYILSSFLIIYILYLDLKKTKDTLSGVLIVILFLYVCYPWSGDLALHIETKNYSSVRYYSYYLSLSPYIYLIFKHSVFGLKTDITKEIKIKAEIKHRMELHDLNKLLELNILTEKEYEQKKENHIKNKIKDNLIGTNEYSLLSRSKLNNLINDEEFNKKINDLINIKYSEYIKK